ncbi:MAG: hypothetical protein LBU26_04195, partial [Synergistaceae bacterium]|nr:hypothetical protein [Synergistaceae bacterium]
MERKRIGFGILAALAFAAFLASPASAAAPFESAPIKSLIGELGTMGGAMTIGGRIHTAAYNAARWLLWTLAIIQFAWASAQLALRGEWTMPHIASLLVKETLFIGFFYWLLTQADPSEWLLTLENPPKTDANNLIWMIARGLRLLGVSAGSAPTPINPAAFLLESVRALHGITDSAFKLGVYNSVWAVVPYALTLVSLSLAAAFAVAYLLEYYVVLPAGIILLGLGGNAASRPFATNYVRVLVSVGMKLLCLQVVLNVAQPLMINASAIFDHTRMPTATLAEQGFFYHAFMFAGFSAVIFISVKTIPQFAANLVTGAYFARVNWAEPGSFPPVAMAGAGMAPRSPQMQGSGAADVQNISGTVTVQNAGEFTGSGGAVGSSLSSGASAAVRQQSGFQGAGFGNYAHDIVFDGAPSSMPDARPAGGMSAASARGGAPDAMSRGGVSDAMSRGGMSDAMARGGAPDAMSRDGMSDAMSRDGMSDAMPRGGASDAMSRDGMSDAMARGGAPDAMSRGGAPDAMSRGGASDAMSRDGMSDAMSRGGAPDAMSRGGVSDAMARGGVSDASARGGVPDASPRGGMSDASARGGVSDASPRGGMPDARPARGMSD